MLPPDPNPARRIRKSTLIAVPIARKGRRRPNLFEERSEIAPATGVATRESRAPIERINPVYSSFRSSPASAVTWLGSTIGRSAAHSKLYASQKQDRAIWSRTRRRAAPSTGT